MKLVFASSNKNKVVEIKQLLPDTIELLSLTDINCLEEIPETQDTIEGNASQKAFYVYNNYHVNCFADDTGLEIEALKGRPGVLSARYAGNTKNADDNMDKVLREMKGISNRKAHFKTVISLVIDNNQVQFEGIINGVILSEKRGRDGFGYDPIFMPEIEGKLSSLSFAEMRLSEKNEISHRAIAIGKLVDYLKIIG